MIDQCRSPFGDGFSILGTFLRNLKTLANRSDWSSLTELAENVQQRKEGIYKDLTVSGIKSFEGISDLILRAKRLRMGLAVASSGAMSKIMRNLTSSGLLQHFNSRNIVSASNVKKGKPAPDVYIEALERLGCTDAQRAVVVEDAIHGMLAAKAAGTHVVGITNSLPKEKIASYCDVVVDHVRELNFETMKPGSIRSANDTLRTGGS